jgi:hypothetical protein
MVMVTSGRLAVYEKPKAPFAICRSEVRRKLKESQ